MKAMTTLAAALLLCSNALVHAQGTPGAIGRALADSAIDTEPR
ncbi:MAG: hypothetical protein ACJ8HI_20415 [Massilia sp.]